MSASQNSKVTWTHVPTRTFTTGGMEFAYRELGTDYPALQAQPKALRRWGSKRAGGSVKDSPAGVCRQRRS